MAIRPIYIPSLNGSQLVSEVQVEFVWVAGMAISQKQKSIRSLHAAAAATKNLRRPLDISSKSDHPLGVQLSAFNLRLTIAGGVTTTVENAYQAGKVFRFGGPYIDILNMAPREAKRDPRLKNSGDIIGFRLDTENWPTTPRTAYYDWLYLTALRQSPRIAEQLLDFDGFTDIEFNPKRSLNCQAAAAALFVALTKRDEIGSATRDMAAFLGRITESWPSSAPIQMSLV
jgi:hypothetical protein